MPSRKVPGVTVDLVLDTGIACLIGRRQVVYLDRRAVGNDDAVPNQKGDLPPTCYAG
jgi:hypothetical protein